MAIAFNAQTQDSFSGTSKTLSHTVTGTNPILLVAIFVGSTASDVVTGVTYNSVSMIRVNSVTNAANASRLYLYALPGPATGANNVVASFSGSQSGEIRAFSYTGVAQTQPEANNTADNGNSSSLSVSVTPLTAGAWVVAAFRASPNDGSAGTNTTERSSGGTTPRVYESSLNPIGTPASTTLQVTGITTNPAWSNLFIAKYSDRNRLNYALLWAKSKLSN